MSLSAHNNIVDNFEYDLTYTPCEEVAADTERDNFMSAQQALEYGLIDEILEKRPV